MASIPKETVILRRNIGLKDGTFDISNVYKKVKKKADELGYVFVEKEQSTKFAKYGQELKLEFFMDKEFDFFGKAEIKINFLFENINKLKNGMDKGNCQIKIEGKQVLDFKNGWGKKTMGRFLFPLYLIIKKEEFKVKYAVPIIKDVNDIHEYIKSLFSEYGPEY